MLVVRKFGLWIECESIDQARRACTVFLNLMSPLDIIECNRDIVEGYVAETPFHEAMSDLLVAKSKLTSFRKVTGIPYRAQKKGL